MLVCFNLYQMRISGIYFYILKLDIKVLFCHLLPVSYLSVQDTYLASPVAF